MTKQNLLITAGVLALGYYFFYSKDNLNPPPIKNTDEQAELILDNLINQINQLNNTI